MGRQLGVLKRYSFAIIAASVASFSVPITAIAQSSSVFWSGGDYESGIQGPGRWDKLQVAGSHSFQRVTSPVRQGKYAARIEIRPGDIAQSSTSARSEVSHTLDSAGKNIAPKDGQTDFFAFSMLLDKSWQAPDDWGIVMQLHSASGNPMFTVRAEDEFYVTTNGGNTCTTSKITAHQFSDGSLNRGKWVDFVFKVKWSTTTNGTITVWRRNQGDSQFKVVLDKSGIANLKSCVSSIYWKTGLYRGPNTTHTSIYYQDGLNFGKTFDDVVQRAFGSSATPVPPTASPTPTPTPTPRDPAGQFVDIGTSMSPFEAESGLIQSPMRLYSNSTASGSTYIKSTSNEAGTASYNLRVQQSGLYALEGRVQADADANSAYIRLNSATEQVWHMQTNSAFAWQRMENCNTSTGVCSPRQFVIEAGEHLFRVRGREANTSMDAFRFVYLGPIASPRIEAESVQPTAGMSIVQSSSASGGRYVTTKSANAGSVTYKLNVPADGSYALEAIVLAPTVGSNSFTVQVGSSSTVTWHIPVKAGFVNRRLGDCNTDGTSCKAVLFTLPAGPVQVTIFGREAAAGLDTLRLIRN